MLISNTSVTYNCAPPTPNLPTTKTAFCMEVAITTELQLQTSDDFTKPKRPQYDSTFRNNKRVCFAVVLERWRRLNTTLYSILKVMAVLF